LATSATYNVDTKVPPFVVVAQFLKLVIIMGDATDYL
jgi:hypothetical protein